MRWLYSDGTLEPVRCGASNRCTYCAMLAAIECSVVVKLDAQIRMPTVGLTTTTRDPAFTLKRLQRAEQSLWRWLRKSPRGPQLGELQYLGFLEWTTGRGTHAGGHRRPHLHHLVKGIPADHELMEPTPVVDVGGSPVVDPDGNPVMSTRLEQVVSQKWLDFTGDAWVVEVRPLRTPAGAIAYLTLHHHKREQAPPPGFRGKRLRPSVGRKGQRGYYELPIAELRVLARELVMDSRVRSAARRAIDVEFYGVEPPERYELDDQLGEAMIGAVRMLALQPPESQRDLFTGEVDDEDDRRELVRLMSEELARVRAERAPELVNVVERDVVDAETGETHRVATAVLGPVETWRRWEIEVERPAPLEVQLRLDRLEAA